MWSREVPFSAEVKVRNYFESIKLSITSFNISKLSTKSRIFKHSISYLVKILWFDLKAHLNWRIAIEITQKIYPYKLRKAISCVKVEPSQTKKILQLLLNNKFSILLWNQDGGYDYWNTYFITLYTFFHNSMIIVIG